MTMLTTPTQINMWVLLSRRAQVKMHLFSLSQGGRGQRGLLAACKRDVPGCENARTVKQCVVPIEFAISEAGGEIDYSLVNVHVMVRRMGMFFDRGIYARMSEVEANRSLVRDYHDGNLEIVLTLDEPREATNGIFVPA